MSVAEHPATAESRVTALGTGVSGARRRLSAGWAGRLLRSELRLIAGRRRNQAGLAVLAAIPIVMAVSIKLSTDDVRQGQGGGGLLDSVTSNGLFVPLAALGIEVVMALPLAMAMLSGDAIAGEANIGTLRYLLTVPVGRARLLAVKYLSLGIGALWGVATVAVSGAAIGVALFGAGTMTTLSGTQIGAGAAVWRVVLVGLYLACGLAALAAVGLFVSTLTEQPIAAAIALMIINIVSWILTQVPQLDWLHPWLLQNWWLAFSDLLSDPMATDRVMRGLGLDAAYMGVFWLLAWARFAGKDITS